MHDLSFVFITNSVNFVRLLYGILLFCILSPALSLISEIDDNNILSFHLYEGWIIS
jgi:hypothetical protein